MARLTYIHDTLYWDDKPVNELNYTERGQMGEYVNNMPEEYESLQNDIRDEIESYRNSSKALLDLTKEELLDDFIDTLKGFLS